VDALRFYDLRPTEDPTRWDMPVVARLCSGLGALFGGCGLGACLEALERYTGRPTVWATAQYLAFAPAGSLLRIDLVEEVRGHQMSQARATARVEGEEIVLVTAALGARESPFEGSWEHMPDVPPPDESAPRPVLDRHRGTIMGELDVRFAKARTMEELPGPPGDGTSALWVRIPDIDMSAAALAIVGDFVPFGIGQSLGQRAGGNSLDNTLRIAARVPTGVPTEWVLADIRVHAVHGGFGHGLVHLWAEDGTLLATASQSTIVRPWRDEPEEARP
jgi:acyl-CoA thioesterase-2